IVQSEQAMRRLGTETEKTIGVFGKLKEAAASAGAALISAFGAYKLIQWLIDGAKAAMEQARALSQLANMAKQFGQDGKEAAKAAQALADALQKKGFQDEVIIAAVRDLIPVTKDYKEALAGATLAADISAKVGMQYSEALSIVQALIGGSDRGLIRAHRELGTSAATAQGALDELRKTFGGSASDLDDNKQKVDSFKAAIEDLWKTIGGPLATAFVWLIDRLKDIGYFFTAIGLRVVDVWDQVKLAFEGMKILISTFDIKHPVDSMKLAMQLFANEEKKFQAESWARWNKWAADVEKAKAGGVGPGKPGGITARPMGGAAGMTTVAGGELDTAKMFEDNLFKEIAALQKYYGKVRDLREKHTQDEKNALAANFRAVKDYYYKLEDVKNAEVELEKRVAAAKAAAQLAAVEGAIGMLMGAFPRSREIAAAQALINTYQAVTKALAEGGPYLGPVLAALMMAAGMAQVRNIYATQPGGAMGGAGGAPGGAFGPPIRVTGAGAPATPPPGSMNTTTVTTNAPATTVVNVNALDTTDALRSAQRALRPASRSYDRTIVARTPIIVGSRRGR
ncbi:MAG: hypothetical protein MUO35_03890, partial [Anaerolineales bacterium]|nr:hypothetical protein [Anaerolineales bacterium]